MLDTKINTVALFTGAWIEMKYTKEKEEEVRRSRSLRARGLKSVVHNVVVVDPVVALFTGAWIEMTSARTRSPISSTSRSLRARGLK